MTQKLYSAALLLILGISSAYATPCERCSQKNLKNCLETHRDCLKKYESCEQPVQTIRELEACVKAYTDCFQMGEKSSFCPTAKPDLK